MHKNKGSVLVIGGMGYIGSHTIVELLSSGYEVVSVDNFANSSSDVPKRLLSLTEKVLVNHELNVCDVESLTKQFSGRKFDAIIHFAASKAVGDSVKDPLGYYDNNINALLGALHLSKLCEAKYFIFSSSAAVYSPNGTPPFDENSPLAPASPYGMTKLVGEMLLRDYATHTPELHAISLRYFNPAGAHPSLLIGENPAGTPNNLVPIITKALREHKPISIFGDTYPTPDGTCIRDYIHVVDVARAHVAALQALEEKPEIKYDVFNVGTGSGVSVREMVQTFEKVTGEKVECIITDKRPGDVAELFANATKANNILNWKTIHSFEEIVQTAWGWENELGKNKK